MRPSPLPRDGEDRGSRQRQGERQNDQREEEDGGSPRERPTPRLGSALSSWQLKFVVLAGIWGMSFLFIKVGDAGLAPLQVAFGRMCCGTITLLALVGIRRERIVLPWRSWGHLAVAALLLNAVPFSLFAYGERQVSSVLAGIFNATTPLTTLPVAALLLADERPSRRRVGGLALGFAGVLVVLGVWSGTGRQDLGGDLLCLAAAACYGAGFPYTRRYLTGTASPLSLACGQLVCGTLELGVITPFATSAPAGPPLRSVLAVVALGLFGTGLAYVLNYAVVHQAGATVASTVTYVMPLFSTAAGVVVLGARLSWYEPVGAVLILLGAAISQGRLLAGRQRACSTA